MNEVNMNPVLSGNNDGAVAQIPYNLAEFETNTKGNVMLRIKLYSKPGEDVAKSIEAAADLYRIAAHHFPTLVLDADLQARVK